MESTTDESKWLSAWIDKLVTPGVKMPAGELRFWQERIVYTFLLLAIALGPIVLVPSVLLSIKEQLWSIAAVDTLMYLATVLIYFKRSWPYQIRAVFVLAVSFLLGMILLVVTGPFGAGPVWLFFFPVVAGILLTMPWTLAALILNLLTIFTVGWLIGTGHLDAGFTGLKPLFNWVVISVNFMFLNTVATLSTVLIVRGLESALIHDRNTMYTLAKTNEELQESNRKLTEEIEARIKAEEKMWKSAQALKDSELRYSDLVNIMPLGYFLIDANFQQQFLNQKTRETFGFDQEQAEIRMGPKTLTFIAPQDRQRAMQLILQVFDGDSIGPAQLTALAADGREFPIEVYVEAVRQENQVIGVQGLIVDISERLEKERLRIEKDTAENTNRAISEWVDFIAHEIRTHISAPLGYSDLGVKRLNTGSIQSLISPMKETFEKKQDAGPEFVQAMAGELKKLEKQLLPEEEKLTEFFQRIFNSSKRLHQMVNELLDLSKLDSGLMTFDIEEADMLVIVEDAVNEMEITALDKQLRLEIVPPDIPTSVACDCFRIGQVLRNLISNAIKFTPEGRRISVSISSSEPVTEDAVPAMQVTVADEGVGIPEDQLQMVFEKFKQSRKTRTGEGTGLGLPICRKIVQAHSGRIWAENGEPSGARFHFTVPGRIEPEENAHFQTDPS